MVSTNNPLTVEFINGESLANPLTLMVDTKSNFGNILVFPLNFRISGEQEDGIPINN